VHNCKTLFTGQREGSDRTHDEADEEEMGRAQAVRRHTTSIQSAHKASLNAFHDSVMHIK